MRLQRLIKTFFLLTTLIVLGACVNPTWAQSSSVTIDRVQLVTQQINLLKSRLSQSEHELEALQLEHDKEISQLTIDKANRNLLMKAGLDTSVTTSNLDSINIELTDCQQTVTWLEKSVQEIENQLNVLSIFGVKVAHDELINIQELRSDLVYQKQLLTLEKSRAKYLQDLQTASSNILILKKENYSRLYKLLKSSSLLHAKQQQFKDELAFQEQQNHWLSELNTLNARLIQIDPEQSKVEYAEVERGIFYASESANYAYSQSLLARYKDQMQQMKLAIMRSDSISLLNEIGDQAQAMSKQIARLDAVMKTRITILQKHVSYLSKKKNPDAKLQAYIANLSTLATQYKTAVTNLVSITSNLTNLRGTLEHSLQAELSSRQGLPTFGIKTFFDLGKEMFLVPTLTFQITKSLSANLVNALLSISTFGWYLFVTLEILFISSMLFLYRLLQQFLARPLSFKDQLNSKWLSLQWFNRNFIDLAVIANAIGVLFYFGIPTQTFNFLIYLSMVWLIFKSIITIARLCLVETTHDTSGHDMRLYHRLKWIILVGGLITALTVFVHQLPLIYELTTLCDRLFLLLLMVVSILLLRSSDVVPNLILSHMKSNHPYLQKSIHLIGVLIPLIMIGNSVIGLIGFMNLIMTVSWYEGVFLVVLVGYLVLRGLLSDGMEQLSRLMIQYVNNGWLWTEAFLKPLDKILRVGLFLVAWAVLFILYGWDKQSPIVERLGRLLQYQLANVLNTTITPLSIIELFLAMSALYWTAKWTREFVYRMLLSRTKDMGLRNSIAILSQYTVVVIGIFICLKVLGIDLGTLTFVASAFAFGIGLGLRDLANNFACGFLILFERPLRVGDIININGFEGEVMRIGSRAVTVRTWDHMELVVPNTEIFNKLFTNWTATDNVVRTVLQVKISRYDNPHEVKLLIHTVLLEHKDILQEPSPEVYLKNMSDTLMEFELRYYVNIRQVKSRTSVASTVLMKVWDVFSTNGIKPPYPQHEIFIRGEMPVQGLIEQLDGP